MTDDEKRRRLRKIYKLLADMAEKSAADGETSPGDPLAARNNTLAEERPEVKKEVSI